jgi:hypothetical protein
MQNKLKESKKGGIGKKKRLFFKNLIELIFVLIGAAYLVSSIILPMITIISYVYLKEVIKIESSLAFSIVCISSYLLIIILASFFSKHAPYKNKLKKRIHKKFFSKYSIFKFFIIYMFAVYFLSNTKNEIAVSIGTSLLVVYYMNTIDLYSYIMNKVV